MANSKATEFLSGSLAWAKVLGEPVTNYNKDGREWTFELDLDEPSIQKLLKHNLGDRIKGKGYNIGTKGQHKDRAPFIQFKKPEFNREGEPNKPIRIYDADDNIWDPQLNERGEPTNLIGNGSKGDVKVDIRDYGVGKKKGIYPGAIRVNEHVEFERTSEFGAMDNDGDDDNTVPAEPAKKTAKKTTFEEDFGLDDDLPI